MENKINYEIPENVIEDVNEKVSDIAELLSPYLIALKPEERKKMPKMGDNTVPFVLKCLEYSVSDPQFAPPFMNKEELTADMKVHGQLTEIFRSVKQLHDGLDDTIMQAGAESYLNALSYYNSVKQAVQMNVPSAKAIYEDLKARFAKSKPKEKPEPAE